MGLKGNGCMIGRVGVIIPIYQVWHVMVHNAVINNVVDVFHMSEIIHSGCLCHNPFLVNTSLVEKVRVWVYL